MEFIKKLMLFPIISVLKFLIFILKIMLIIGEIVLWLLMFFLLFSLFLELFFHHHIWDFAGHIKVFLVLFFFNPYIGQKLFFLINEFLEIIKEKLEEKQY